MNILLSKSQHSARLFLVLALLLAPVANIMAGAASPRFNNMSLFSVAKEPGGYRMIVNGSQASWEQFLTDQEVREMKLGKYENPAFRARIHRFCAGSLAPRALVLYTAVNSNPSDAKLAIEFAHALQNNYPDERIYRDPLSGQTDARVGRLIHVVANRPASLAAIIAPESFVNQTSIRNIQDELTAKHVRVFEYTNGAVASWTGETNLGIIVVTGHSSEGLMRFVDTIGKAGFFRDNIVVFNSCGTELTESMISRINSDHGAIATLGFQGTIEASKVNLFLLDVTEKAFEKNYETCSFTTIAIECAVKHQLSGLWTVCCVNSSAPTQSYARYEP
jgi:hypothetical protein